MPVNKEDLRQAAIKAVAEELARLTHAALDARDESISEESRPENKYDTHAQEAAYLAEGQARLATELNDALNAWRSLSLASSTTDGRAQLGSLVTISAGNRRDRILLGPANGGLALSAPDDSNEITVVTPASPLGRLLLGRMKGDSLPPLRAGLASRKISEVE